MRNFIDRLNWLIGQASKEEKRMSLERFGQPIHYSKGQLSKLLSGEAKPETVHPRFWEGIERVYGVPSEWLLTGAGPEPVVRETKETEETFRESFGEESTKRECLEHFHAFLEECAEDQVRLGWTLIELRKHFPLGMWEAQAEPRRIPGVSSVSVSDAARALAASAAAKVSQASSRKREADEPSEKKHPPKHGVEKG